MYILHFLAMDKLNCVLSKNKGRIQLLDINNILRCVSSNINFRGNNWNKTACTQYAQIIFVYVERPFSMYNNILSANRLGKTLIFTFIFILIKHWYHTWIILYCVYRVRSPNYLYVYLTKERITWSTKKYYSYCYHKIYLVYYSLLSLLKSTKSNVIFNVRLFSL